jgi:ribosome-associated protein
VLDVGPVEDFDKPAGTDRQSRDKTTGVRLWAVRVMRETPDVPGPLRVRSVTIPETDLSWRFSRSSSPGGQSVNTSDSRAELLFDVAHSGALTPTMRRRALDRLGSRLVDGVLTIAASEHRSQLRNREAAESRLVEILTEATAPPAAPRRATKPTRGSVERRLAGKQRRSQVKRMRRPDSGE